MNKRQGHPFAVVIPLSAIVVTIALVLNARADVLRSQAIPTAVPAELAVEHSAPLTLRLQMSTGKREGIAELTTDTSTTLTPSSSDFGRAGSAGGGETTAISIPSSWQRREVRGAALDVVTSEPAVMGFIRWHVPPGVTVSFRVTDDDSGLIVRNPSGIPLLIIGKRVNVLTEQVEEKSVLVKDGAARLW